MNHLYGPEPFFVACDNSVEGGDYKAGFGYIDGELFIGLDKLHALTSTLKPVELLIQLQDFENVTKYIKYDDFQVGNETENYQLIKVGSYVGNVGDSFSQHVGYNFSTKDRDNDIVHENCAVVKTGAWWYRKCYFSNLNGKYYQDPTDLSLENGITWGEFHGYKYSLKFVQMLIRPRKL
ncbi:hypothetical protein DOY81_010870 [Sarcophaga bullata]|nr:hypothetical protein DOY81_010870 [Sarcophaga bullata]